jgi:ribonuclease HII
MQDLLVYEKEIWAENLTLVGVDEVGRGCLAGPVVAGAVIIPQDPQILEYFKDVNDSKKITEKKRRELFYIIQKYSISYGIGIVSANVIDQINILQASFLAMRRALNCIEKNYNYVLVDGNKKIPNISIEQKAIVKGDSKSLSIASASILAKVIRDEIMIELDKSYIGYSLSKHKGYPTKVHFSAIEKIGLSDIHRLSFCKRFLLDNISD